MEVSGRDGAPLKLRVISGNHAAEADSELKLTSARTSSLTDVVLRQQLDHLGDTGYFLRNFKSKLEGDVFIPIRFINQLRRDAISRLDAVTAKQRSVQDKGASCPGHVPEDSGASERQSRRSPESALSGLLLEAKAHGDESPELITLCRTFEQIDAAIDAAIETVYIDFEDIRLYQKAIERIGDRAHVFLATPRIQKSGEQGFFRLIENARPYGVLIRNLGSISFFRDKGFRLHGDFSLNVANPLAAHFFVQRGLQQLTVSYDLSIKEVLSLLRYDPASCFELTIHQHMPMFHMEHCVFAAFLSDGTDYTNCGRPCDRHVLKLRDRVGSEHLIKADVGCRNTVFNARPQTGAPYAQALLAAGLRRFRIEFLTENRSAAAHLISVYRRLLRGEIPGEEVWRDLKVHLQLGVTKGTLE
jgi:putative protease